MDAVHAAAARGGAEAARYRASAWIASVVLLACGGASWVVALATPMTTQGPGSAESSREFADLILSGSLGPFANRWWGTWWYAAAFAGCLVLASCALRPSLPLQLARLGLAAGVSIGSTLIGLHLTGKSVALLGVATWTCLAGAGACVAGVALATWSDSYSMSARERFRD